MKAEEMTHLWHCALLIFLLNDYYSHHWLTINHNEHLFHTKYSELEGKMSSI